MAARVGDYIVLFKSAGGRESDHWLLLHSVLSDSCEKAQRMELISRYTTLKVLRLLVAVGSAVRRPVSTVAPALRPKIIALTSLT